jgi:hypothetical protein
VKHIADAESGFTVTNINPDFCDVDGTVIPFDIMQVLSEENTDYAENFFSRGAKVLRVGSIVKGVVGNAGEGVLSGVSQGEGHTITIEGSKRLFVGGKAVCHHLHRVLMNVKV